MRYPKRSQYKYAKSRYRVRNWGDYETGLQRRGTLTVYLSDAALEGWRAPATGEVLASNLTSRRTADCARVPALLDQIDDRVATFMADGAYDTGAVYEAARESGERRVPIHDRLWYGHEEPRSGNTVAGLRVSKMGLGRLELPTSRLSGLCQIGQIPANMPGLSGPMSGPNRYTGRPLSMILDLGSVQWGTSIHGPLDRIRSLSTLVDERVDDDGACHVAGQAIGDACRLIGASASGLVPPTSLPFVST